jgi:hypothetical protein
MSGEKGRISYLLLVDCAESFQRTAELSIDGIYPRLPEGSSETPPPGLGELVCCATNLGFSLELYLKAIHVRLSDSYPQGHNLSKLYAALPPKVKQSIELIYDESVKSMATEVHAPIMVAKGPQARPTGRNTPRNRMIYLRGTSSALGGICLKLTSRVRVLTRFTNSSTCSSVSPVGRFELKQGQREPELRNVHLHRANTRVKGALV